MKRLVAKIGSFQDKDGKEKGEYANVGVLMENSGGEYILLNAEFCIAGILLKQCQLAHKLGKKQPSNVMLSVFADNPPPQQAAPQQSATQQQSGRSTAYDAQNQASRTQAPAQDGPGEFVEDDIPF